MITDTPWQSRRKKMPASFEQHLLNRHTHTHTNPLSFCQLEETVLPWKQTRLLKNRSSSCAPLLICRHFTSLIRLHSYSTPNPRQRRFPFTGNRKLSQQSIVLSVFPLIRECLFGALTIQTLTKSNQTINKWCLVKSN